MKTIFNIAFVALFSAMLSFGENIDAWLPMEWKEYRPLPKMEQENGTFHAGKVISKSGLLLKANILLPAKSGDDLIFQALVKGTGTATLKMEYFDKTERWCGFSKQKISISFTDEWKQIKTALPITDTQRGSTSKVLLTLEMSAGSECYIKDAKAEIENNGIQTNVPFPAEWIVFILEDTTDATNIPLDMIPEEINNIHWKLRTLSDGFIDFSQDFNILSHRKNAVLYSYLYSPAETDYTIGAGADGYMALYLNSELIIDTMKTGNGPFPVNFSNHQAKVKLRKGHNIIAVHYQTGKSKRPRIALGGADVLKNMHLRLKVLNYLQKGVPNSTAQFHAPEQFGEKNTYKNGDSILFDGSQFTSALHSFPKPIGIGLKIYSLSSGGNILVSCGNSLKMKIAKNDYTEGMIVSIFDKDALLKDIHLPRDLWPCSLIFSTNGKEYFLNASAIGTEKLSASQGKIIHNLTPKLDFNISVNECNAEIGDFFIATFSTPNAKE